MMTANERILPSPVHIELEQLATRVEETLIEMCDIRFSLACALEDNRQGIGAREAIIEELILTMSEPEPRLFDFVRFLRETSLELEEKLEIQDHIEDCVYDPWDDE